MGRGGERGKGKRYSFAKTPLKAAQAPLAAARASQEGDLKLILFLGSGGGGHSWCGGRRGSAAGSIEDFFQGRGGMVWGPGMGEVAERKDQEIWNSMEHDNAPTFILVVFAHHCLSIWISQESIYRLLSGDGLACPALEKKRFQPSLSLCLPRSLCVAAHDFDSIGLNSVLIVELEVDIFDKEGPDFIAEPIGVQVTLAT